MYFGSHMPVPHEGKGHLSYNIISVFYPNSFINAFVIGIHKLFVAYPGAAKQGRFNIPVWIIVLNINSA